MPTTKVKSGVRRSAAADPRGLQDEVYTYEEAGEVLKVSARQIQRWCEELDFGPFVTL